MDKSCLKPGLHCSYQGGKGTITEVDEAKGLAILTEDGTGIVHACSHLDLSVDDEQFHDADDRYY